MLCGLCVRYCNEVKQNNAAGDIENGPLREISFVPEVARDVCWDCQECLALYPTSCAQAAYLLAEALAFPGQRKTAVSAKKAPKRASRVIPIMPVASTT